MCIKLTVDDEPKLPFLCSKDELLVVKTLIKGFVDFLELKWISKRGFQHQIFEAYICCCCCWKSRFRGQITLVSVLRLMARMRRCRNKQVKRKQKSTNKTMETKLKMIECSEKLGSSSSPSSLVVVANADRSMLGQSWKTGKIGKSCTFVAYSSGLPAQCGSD